MCVHIQIHHEVYTQHRKFLQWLAKLKVTRRRIIWEISGNHSNKQSYQPSLYKNTQLEIIVHQQILCFTLVTTYFSKELVRKSKLGKREICGRSLLHRKYVLLLSVRKFQLWASNLTSKKRGTFFPELKLWARTRISEVGMNNVEWLDLPMWCPLCLSQLVLWHTTGWRPLGVSGRGQRRL